LKSFKYPTSFQRQLTPEGTMDWYQIAKVVHFMGLIALFGFFVIYARAGTNLRASTTMSDARAWLRMLEATKGMLPGGAAMFLVSGVAMTAMRWRGPYPFVTVGLVALLTLWIVGSLVGPRHLRAMRFAIGDTDGPVPATVRHVILDPAPWGTIATLNGATLGVLFVMTTKGGWVPAIAIVVGLAALVGGISTRSVRRQRAGVTT
jgi:hypothetical protein